MTAATYAFAQLIRVLPRTKITRAVGKLVDMRLPRPVARAAVAAYARAYRVDLDEAEPLDGGAPGVAYDTFDSFFTRRLRPGARQITAPAGTLVSPSDGRLDAVGDVERDGIIHVKRRPYHAADLLGGDAHAEKYLGGQFGVIYLAPRDYHRVHAPVDSTVVEVRSYPGELFPVNGVSERHIPGFLARNRRVAIVLRTPSYGDITVVMVAAMIVGRISVSGIDARDVPFGTHAGLDYPVARGDEIGIFHLGSTAVIFCEPKRCPRIDRGLGTVRLGDALHAPEGAVRHV